MSKYLRGTMNTKVTPQSEAIPGSTQVANSAGGFSWAVTDWTRLDRFLVLGSEGGSYYASERKLTKENAAAVQRCVRADGPRAVARITEISVAGRAPKQDPALFALALAAAYGDEKGKAAAYEALPQIARIGTDLMHFVAFLDEMTGWSRGKRSAVARWYTEMPVEKLAYQAVKYQSRDKWAHRDILRLAHPKTTDATRNAILHWMVNGWESVGAEPHPDAALRLIWAFERAKLAQNEAEIVKLVRECNLPREAVPTNWLNSKLVWEALLDKMPMTAMIRNLAKMTRVGLIAPLSDATRKVVEELHNADRIKKARVHPISVLAALLTYEQGRGERSDASWSPVSQVIDALNDAFYLSFGAVTPTGKNTMLALDASASMTWTDIAGIPGLKPREASAAMSMVTAAVEPQHMVTAFSSGRDGGWRGGSGIETLDISPRMRLTEVVRRIEKVSAGGTDCALPVLYAMEKGLRVDTFIVYTDSETWAGNIHPSQALKQYREKTGIPAKLIVVGMQSNGFSIADPQDAGMLDVVGFDTATPEVMSGFSKGDF